MTNVGANQFKSCHSQSNSILGCSASHLPFIGMNAKWLASTFNVFCTVSIIPMHWPSEMVPALGKEELNLAIERSFIFWTVNSERLIYKELKKDNHMIGKSITMTTITTTSRTVSEMCKNIHIYKQTDYLCQIQILFGFLWCSFPHTLAMCKHNKVKLLLQIIISGHKQHVGNSDDRSKGLGILWHIGIRWPIINGINWLGFNSHEFTEVWQTLMPAKSKGLTCWFVDICKILSHNVWKNLSMILDLLGDNL